MEFAMHALKMPQVYIQKNCPLCQSKKVFPIKTELNDFATDKHQEVRDFDNTWIQLLQCEDCSFAFSKEIPSSPGWFSKRYDIEFDVQAEEENPMKNHMLIYFFNMLEEYGRTSGKFLDIGCFAGITLSFAQKKGYQVEGIEVNPTMAKHAKDVVGHKVFMGEFLDFPCNKNTFDVITMVDVLEHLLTPREVLQRCFEIQKPGGHILIKVPNLRGQYIKQKMKNVLGICSLGIFAGFAHINQFSPLALEKVLTSVGYEPLECRVSPIEVWGNKGLKYRLFNSIRTLGYHFLRAIHILTGINMGTSIVYLAKKPEEM